MKELENIKDHILVCLSSSPSNKKVIDTASRMAKVFNAEFTALYIESANKMSRDNELRLQQNTEFARERGANIVTLSGEDIAFQVSEYAKKSQVTKIILGRSGYRPNRLFTPPNFVDKIIKYSPEIEIYIIPDKAQKMYFGQQENKKNKFSIFSYPGLTISILILLLFDYFFTEPRFSLAISGFPVVFLILFVFVYFVAIINQKQKDAMLREIQLTKEKEDILQAKNELIIKNKQEEMRSTLLRAISHDLRTPLTGISGFAEILLKNSNILSEDKKQHIYSDIYDDSIWLLNLVENLLAITRFDKNEIKLNKESEYISDVIRDAVSHLGRKKEKFFIHINVEKENLSAYMDSRLISQVIFNLVDNAMKYSPEGTNIVIKAEADGNDLKISVIDEGAGISDEDKAKIFDMFYTVNNKIADGRRGLGLGLALCKAVIEAHGGKVNIMDNKPCGTIFSFDIKSDVENDNE